MIKDVDADVDESVFEHHDLVHLYVAREHFAEEIERDKRARAQDLIQIRTQIATAFQLAF